MATGNRKLARMPGSLRGVALGVSTLLGACGGGPAASDPPRAEPSSEAAQSGAAEPADAPNDDTAWWRLQFDPMAMGPDQTIEVGTLGAGVVATIDVPMQVVDPNALVFPMRSVIGPRNGLVVTVEGDGAEAVLWSIDAASGEERELARTADVIVDAVFATGTSVVFLTVNPRTGAFTGAWRVDAAAPDGPEPVEGLLAAAEIQLAARSVGHTRLFASPTGDVVAVQHCTAAGACVIRALNVVDGTRYEQPLAAADEPMGLAGERVFLRPVCMAECAGELLDLASGERAPVPEAGTLLFFEQTVVAMEGGPVLVTQLSGHTTPMQGPAQPPTYVVTRLADATTAAPVAVALGSMRIVSAQSYELGIELPPGWFAVMGAPPVAPGEAPNVPLKVFAVSAADGSLVPLPALGEFLNQG
jgi:hypothetical protein